MRNEFLATLSPLDRQIWELRQGWDYEYDEIEERLPEAGLNADSIRYRFKRAFAAAQEYGAR
jgi:DNA-directed RNA polymerase specialized sigma24 family protein